MSSPLTNVSKEITDEKIARMKQKNNLSSYDKSLMSKSELIEKLEKELERSLEDYSGVLKINTTHRTVDDVGGEVLDIITKKIEVSKG